MGGLCKKIYYNKPVTRYNFPSGLPRAVKALVIYPRRLRPALLRMVHSGSI